MRLRSFQEKNRSRKAGEIGDPTMRSHRDIDMGLEIRSAQPSAEHDALNSPGMYKPGNYLFDGSGTLVRVSGSAESEINRPEISS
jgi:hypothetical protein